MKSKVRTPEAFPESLNRRLNAYVLAAGAASVALASSLPAEGEAVCINTDVLLYGGDTYQLIFPGQKIPAFNLAQTFTTGCSLPYVFFNRGFLIANTQGASAVLADNSYPAALSSEATVGPSGKFGKGKSYGLLFTYASQSRSHGKGNFTRSTNYAGVRFSISGQTHFGWARIKITAQPAREPGTYVTVIHLQAVGFETVADKPIQVNANCHSAEQASTPTTDASDARSTGNQKVGAGTLAASLGMLALGAEVVPRWRKAQ